MTTSRNQLASVSNALKELTPQQSLFLASLLELGGGPQHAGEAAWNAGYGKTQEEAERAARILLDSPKIMKALKDAIAHRFDVAASAAQATLLEICIDRKAPARARISAAQELLSRAPSIGPVPSRSMSVTATTTIEDIWARMDAQDAREKEGAAATIEGSAVDVTPTPVNKSDS